MRKNFSVSLAKNALSRIITRAINRVLMPNGLIAIPKNERVNSHEVIDQFVNKNYVKVVFDIGSYSGDWARTISKRHFPAARLYLFEANEVHFPYPEGLSDGSFQVLLAEKAGVKKFYAIGGTGDSSYRENSNLYDFVQPREIACESLNNLMKQHNLPIPDFVKIDVQGSELDVLKGMNDCLKLVKYLLVETNLSDYNVGAPSTCSIIQYLKEFGFIARAIAEVHIAEGSLSQCDILFENSNLPTDSLAPEEDSAFAKQL